MMNRMRKSLSLFAAIGLLSGGVYGGIWEHIIRPSAGRPEVIGGPAAGCVAGAETLAVAGVGFQVMRLSRQRIYGHPSLINYLRNLGKTLDSEGIGVMLVGDLGQPRGGPTASLHRSHQNGLDVDIWFWLPEIAQKRRLTPNEIEHLSAPSVLAANHRKLNYSQWGFKQEQLLRLAAAPAEVERIFVHPMVKKELCDQEPAEDRAWLRKIRPWWNHDDHLHVRLRCPAEDSHCSSQKPLPPGEGCDADLAWWLAAVATPAPKRPAPPPPNPVLPPACDAVLSAP